ncbi:MAG: DUF2520 domain-containing protein [Prevotellaceae bacterium]|nr:DUF2520 domain-containing protein [Prevotellaceae bacterium]
MKQEKIRISCIGSGGVASSLLPALYDAGCKIVQVCSRNIEHAQRLAKVVGAMGINHLAELNNAVELIIISISDSEIEGVLKAVNFGNAMVVHTAGSVPMQVMADAGVARYGVLYPLQTFSCTRSVSLAQVPLFIEAANPNDLQELKFLAKKISSTVTELDSQQRMLLHVAAVFACNFTNHMMTISASLLKNVNQDFELVKPLIQETFEKALAGDNPAEAQTGPAVRGDVVTVKKHMEALKNDTAFQQLYQLISENIMKK